eukprot:CAMPEP_0174941170 /NCGR_PEP_ID=MMETSP1355-20121228/71008_1 /TAXON_ID=464990 /ORGANISM="Hemiselmis tepida, Strain CCMP443" /LENGTH=169 /DNA_ID=CAMNT_0016188257 /DNA_START=90 /DNA_END=596 /DNA_ORIENTATION=+
MMSAMSSRLYVPQRNPGPCLSSLTLLLAAPKQRPKGSDLGRDARGREGGALDLEAPGLLPVIGRLPHALKRMPLLVGDAVQCIVAEVVDGPPVGAKGDELLDDAILLLLLRLGLLPDVHTDVDERPPVPVAGRKGLILVLGKLDVPLKRLEVEPLHTRREPVDKVLALD